MNLWEQVLRKIEPKLNDQVFDTWLKPTHQVSMTEDILEVEVPSSFFAEWISSHYLPMLRDSLSEIHPGDLAALNYEEEGALDLLENEEQLLREINDALDRIERGTFGHGTASVSSAPARPGGGRAAMQQGAWPPVARPGR